MKDINNYNEWPWKGESETFPAFYKGNKPWPKVSVIIPSFNQGAYIEETILSVIKQNYPNLELIVIDGGSEDNTVDVLKKYEKNIDYWVSEKDKGQSHAINKGMDKATGEWISWLNSDDCYLKNGFLYLFNEIDIESYEFVYGNYLSGESLNVNREIKSLSLDKLNLRNVIRFFYGIDYIIPSQSVFMKRELCKKIGRVNETLHYCMDLDWYIRGIMLKPKAMKYSKTISFFRYNENTKTGSFRIEKNHENKLGMEAESIALNYSCYLNKVEYFQFRNLYNFYLMYSKAPWLYDQCSLLSVMKIVVRHPFRSLGDRRILGLFKRKLLFR